jgi:hypothetical protein
VEDLQRKASGQLNSAPDNSTLPGLRRDKYPFRYGFYDHSHETKVNSKTELGNRKTGIWRGYYALVENYVLMVRGGGRWDELDVVLHHAITGLSYDLATLQANYVIARGLRGDEAMRVFWEEATEILEEVTSAWLAIRERLGVTVEDEAKGSSDLQRPFHRVRDDLRHLLHDLLAPRTDTEPAAQASVAQQESGTEAASCSLCGCEAGLHQDRTHEIERGSHYCSGCQSIHDLIVKGM